MLMRFNQRLAQNLNFQNRFNTDILKNLWVLLYRSLSLLRKNYIGGSFNNSPGAAERCIRQIL